VSDAVFGQTARSVFNGDGKGVVDWRQQRAINSSVDRRCIFGGCCWSRLTVSDSQWNESVDGGHSEL
jgi:hypothetical protein